MSSGFRTRIGIYQVRGYSVECKLRNLDDNVSSLYTYNIAEYMWRKIITNQIIQSWKGKDGCWTKGSGGGKKTPGISLWRINMLCKAETLHTFIS